MSTVHSASIDMTINEKYEVNFYAYERSGSLFFSPFCLLQMTKMNEENRPCSHRGKFSMKTVGDEDGKFIFVRVCECILDGSFSMRNRKSIMEMFFHDFFYEKRKKSIKQFMKNFFSLFRKSFVHGDFTGRIT